MALTAADRKAIGEIVAAGIAAALASVPTGAPARPTASDGIVRSKDGRDFACSVEGLNAEGDIVPGCGRKLRSPERAKVHAKGAALTTGGHQPGEGWFAA